MQQLKYCSHFSHELALKKLVNSGKVSIVYIHGSARSGSTIAEIILTQLVDLTIHQPFRGILQKQGGYISYQPEFDNHIYNSACGVIVNQINQYLARKSQLIVVIKELAGFFNPVLWQRWSEIPERFLFTIRDPHLQYMSWLSAMTDKIFQGQGKLQNNHNFVLENANITEKSALTAEWQGTTISCNESAWNALWHDFNQVQKNNINSSKKIAILDSILLRYQPEIAISHTIKKLGFTTKQLADLKINNLLLAKSKIIDIRDKNRPMVRKANKSKMIAPLPPINNNNLNIFPSRSQQHIKNIIPLYLNLLYADDQAYIPSLVELETTDLIKLNPFITYAIALWHFSDPQQGIDWYQALAKQKSLSTKSWETSLEIINDYWQIA